MATPASASCVGAGVGSMSDTRRAMAPDGILVMASCTGRLPAASFFSLIHDAAAAHGRPLADIYRTGHPLDHPVTFPEGAYLKCLFSVAP